MAGRQDERVAEKTAERQFLYKMERDFELVDYNLIVSYHGFTTDPATVSNPSSGKTGFTDMEVPQ